MAKVKEMIYEQEPSQKLSTLIPKSFSVHKQKAVQSETYQPSQSSDKETLYRERFNSLAPNIQQIYSEYGGWWPWIDEARAHNAEAIQEMTIPEQVAYYRQLAAKARAERESKLFNA